MWPPTRLARWAVALLLCLPAAVACDQVGSEEGAGPSGGAEGGGVPGPGKGGGSGGGSGGKDGGGKPGPLKIPEWGANGFLFDDKSPLGKSNWRDVRRSFVEACKDGTLCVNLVRVYRTEDGRESEGPCGYDHMEPAGDTWVERGRTVYVVGVCGPEGPGDVGESEQTGEPEQTGSPEETGGPDTQPTDGTPPDAETATATAS
ncbi:hypothetical protein ACFY8W_25000 [Streptomyces sp. NPDC012637]|uniref:hypothetical protein n=1 Tax=Streptomyces sp. NPDC012637 TaxID=3364842 RepID=UPI0036E8DE18